MSVHQGHRQRVRQRYIDEGLDSFNEHEALEMLLFYCLARKDTNELAHNLLNEFGSLHAVMEATPAQLANVPGVGDGAAVFLQFISDFNRYVQVRKKESECSALTSCKACGEYLFPKFYGCRNEVVYLLCLDSKCKILGCKCLGEGSVNSAAVPIRRIVEYALNLNASFVVLAHNHTSGVAVPSMEDLQTTRALSYALNAVDVLLADHIIFSDEEFTSMFLTGYFTGENILFGVLDK